jgi:hypothetical protein
MKTNKAQSNSSEGSASRPRPRHVWCDTLQAAEYIHSTPKTLEHWRRVGGGPRYAKAGRRCLYRYDWLDEWLESRTTTSTAEARKKGLL